MSSSFADRADTKILSATSIRLVWRLNQQSGGNVKPLDDSGREVDATFSIEIGNHGFDVIIESRSGGAKGSNRVRNSEYALGLELLLSRLSRYSPYLISVMIDSAVSRSRATSERLFIMSDFPMPLLLAPSFDVTGFRLELGRQSSAFGRTSDFGGGNRTKRLRLMFGPVAGLTSAEEIKSVLAHPKGVLSIPVARSAAEADIAFSIAVHSALRHLRDRDAGAVYAGSAQAPTGRIYDAFRFDRRPDVVAAVLFRSKGKCEVCDQPAPFVRDNGEAFLEVHHVRRLAEGGPDASDNAVACCPNRHRRLHYGNDRRELRETLLAKIAVLVDYPQVRFAVDAQT
jgi:5-methylcytosine-specific restriction protein A